MSLMPRFAVCPVCHKPTAFLLADEHVRSCANDMAKRFVKTGGLLRRDLAAGLTNPETRRLVSGYLAGEMSAVETLVRGLTDDPEEQEHLLALFREDAAETR